MEIDYKTAAQAIVRISTAMELEFLRKSKRKDIGPLQYIAVLFRRDAIAALAKLAEIDAEDAAAIRRCQNDVRRFVEVIDKIQVTLSQGDDAHDELQPEEQEEVRRLITEEHGLSAGDYE